MRGVFSFLGLLVVIAVLAVVARHQMPGMQPSATPVSAPSSSASATFEQRAGSPQQQIVDDANRLMQQRQGQIEGQIDLPAAGASNTH